MIPPWHVGVLIPARNEENLLPRCLRSIKNASLHLPLDTTFDIVVAVDSSTDRTAKIAQNLLSDSGTVVYTKAGQVGCARRLAAQALLERYRGPLDRCWLANTDADCRVPYNWLKEQLRLANDHIEAVAGTVDVDSFVEHSAGVAERFRSSYLIRPDGSHNHVHGANLGIRADAYIKAGGWGALSTAEDHDLWERLRRSGAKRVAVNSTEVMTSGRRVGRAPFGFAGALAAHDRVAS